MENFGISQAQLEQLLAGNTPAASEIMADLKPIILEQGIVIVPLYGKILGVNASHSMIQELLLLITDKPVHLILDLHECVFLSSLMIGQLVLLANEQEKKGYKLILVNAHEQVRDILELIGLDKRIFLFVTMEEALASLS